MEEKSVFVDHDVFDRIGGGELAFTIDRSFRWGPLRVTPEAGFVWSDAEMASHDFGVPNAKATPQRPAYYVSDTFNTEMGVGFIYELLKDTRFIFNIAVESLDSKIRNSPIVDENKVYRGFTALNYVF